MKTKATRHALLMSALLLVLCVSLLIGTTFAWFTDSATSANNIIASGNLDAEMYWAEGAETVPTAQDGWTDASTGAIFDYNNWEPGYVQARHIKLANVGSLAFKYKLNIVPTGTVSKLADVIDVYFIEGARQIARADLANLAPIGTLGDLINDTDGVAYGALLPAGKTKTNENERVGEVTATIAFKMRESAGNDYQLLKIGDAFAIQLSATQYTFESDSFDNQYDAGATYDFKVSTADELAAALEEGGMIEVQDDITFTNKTSIVIPEGTDSTLSLNGHTLTNPVKAAAALVNNGSLTISGGTIVNENIEAQGAAAIHNYGDLVLDNVNVGSDLNRGAAVQNKGGNIVINGGFFATMTRAHPSNGYAYVFINNSGTMEINNAEVNGYPNGIFYADSGTIDVNGGKYIIKDGGNTWYVAYAGGDSKINLNSGEYHWYKLYCDAATTGNVVVSEECIINW